MLLGQLTTTRKFFQQQAPKEQGRKSKYYSTMDYDHFQN
jgi:hypothetical protein